MNHLQIYSVAVRGKKGSEGVFKLFSKIGQQGVKAHL